MHERVAIAGTRRTMTFISEHQSEGPIPYQVQQSPAVHRRQRLNRRHHDIGVAIGVAVALLDAHHRAGIEVAEGLRGLVYYFLAVNKEQQL